MNTLHLLKPLSATALFSASDFCEVNQLADLLFDAEEQSICLYSEHETVTQAWILSALNKSVLAKKSSVHPGVYWSTPESESATFPENSWVYLGNGQLIRTGSAQEKIINLRFRTLSFEQRAKVLHQVCIESLQTHVLTIPAQTIKKALEWQARYCADAQVLAETLLLLHRAVNRFLLTHADDKQAALLEPQHVAEVLIDWQQVALPDLLRLTEDVVELKLFLSEHIIGQTLAIEQFIQEKNRSQFFILAGTPYSGKKTFIEHYAQFTHGAKCFCISFDLSFFASDSSWPEIFLPTPHYNNDHSRLNLLEIVSTYPQAVILLKNANENPVLLDRLKRNIKKSFFQIDGQCISIVGITWMLLLDTAAPEPKPLVVQESIFAIDTSLELSDILYRPSIKISTDVNESIEINENHAVEEVKKQLSETIFESACLLSFSPLTEKDKKQIINKEIKRIMHSLRTTHDVSVYYQEEVIQFLLNQVNQANQGFEALHKNLHHQIEHVFLKSLEQGVIADGQVLMLQLNDTGRVLQIVRTVARTGSMQAKLKM